MSSSADAFRRAMADPQQSGTWSRSVATVAVRPACNTPGCKCCGVSSVVVRIGESEAAFTTPELADALADAVAACRVRLWGPRKGS